MCSPEPAPVEPGTPEHVPLTHVGIKRPARLHHHRFAVGQVVRFASKMRPDHLPFSCRPYGIITATGIWSVTVTFYDMPDEPLYLGATEIVMAPGRTTTQVRGELERAARQNWTRWE